MTKDYTVDWQLAQIVYFESENQLPDLDGYQELWEVLSQFGDRTVSGSFWSKETLSSSKIRKIRLGDPAPFIELRKKASSPPFGGGCYTRRNAAIPHRDSDFYVGLHGASRSKAGPTLPCFQMAVSSDWLSTIDERVLLGILRENFEILDRFKPIYGFVEISAAADTYAGQAYSPVISGNVPLRRLVEEANWAKSVAAGEICVRSIYWGNYFGARLLERLGGKGKFEQELDIQIRRKDSVKSGLVWNLNRGTFVSLTSSARELAPGKCVLDAEDNLFWLHDRLCHADVI